MSFAPKGWSTALLAVSLLVLALVLFWPKTDFSAPEVIPEDRQETPQGTATLSILPPSLDLVEGSRTSLAVFLEVEEQVTAVELHLSFNPQVLQIEDITPADFFPQANVLVREIREGEATFVVGGLAGRKGKGQVAKFNIVALNAGQTQLDFARSTQIAALDKTESVLGKAIGATIRVETK